MGRASAMRFLILALVALSVVDAKKNAYDCTHEFNFITGVKYNQIDLTDGCTNDNTVYNPENNKNCPKKAVRYCQSRCDETPDCRGFFFQKHQNGHEICGFYTGLATMHAPNAQWVKHGHRAVSQVCEVVDTPTATQPATVQRVQITMQLTTAVQEFAESNPAFDVAFRTTIAGLAGHVCDDYRLCAPDDVPVTSLASTSITFQIHLANGQLASQVAANIQAHVEGGHFAASLMANGITDAAALEKTMFGEVNVDPEPEIDEPEIDPAPVADEHPAGALKLLRGARLCVVLMPVLGLAALVMLAMRSFRQQSTHVQLAEAPSEEAVVVDVATPEYAKVAEDETAKVELDETSKDQA